MEKRYKLVEISNFCCKNQEVHATEYHDGVVDHDFICKLNKKTCNIEDCKNVKLDGFTKEEMIEKMAKAMRQAKFPKTKRIPSWDDMDSDYQAEYLGQAEAALDALLGKEEGKIKNKFKPCPFCGYDIIKVFDMNDFYGSGRGCLTYCTNCSCHGPEANTEQEAIEAWNKRSVK